MNKDMLKAIAEVDCAGKAAGAELVKSAVPFMVPWLAWWCYFTMPNTGGRNETKSH